MTEEFSRRQVLGALGVGLTAGIAGCNSSDSQEKTETDTAQINATLDGESPNYTETGQNPTETPTEYETDNSTQSEEEQLDPFCQHELEEDDTLNFHFASYSTGENEEYSLTNLDVHPEQGVALRFEGDLGGLEDETHIWVNEGYEFQLREDDEAYTVSEIDYDEETIIIEDC